MPARIRQGRWVVTCPAVGCGGALLVTADPALFICCYCGSPENGGRWYHVAFPADEAAIEAELLRRPARSALMAEQRNWEPHESLADLQRENREHGIP